MVVEAASQRFGGCRHDVSESGHDVGNPYTCGKRALVNRPDRHITYLDESSKLC